MSEPTEPAEPATEAADTAITPGGKPTEPAELAWSLDTEETPTHDHRWRGPVTSAALVALLCLIVAVVTWFSITLYHQNDSQPPASAPSSSAPAHKTDQPPPAPVTVTAASPPATDMPVPTTTTQAPASVMSAADWGFLNAISDIAAAPSPAYAITHAHAVCSYAAQHPNDYTGTIRFVQTTTLWTANQAYEFADAAMQVYCPSALPPDF